MTPFLEKSFALTGGELAGLLAVTLSGGLIMGASLGILILALMANSRSDDR